MENAEYYTELTGDFMESQCMYDLRNGKIIITDVPCELPVSKEAGFLRNQSKDTGFEPAGSLFSCLSG